LSIIINIRAIVLKFYTFLKNLFEITIYFNLTHLVIIWSCVGLPHIIVSHSELTILKMKSFQLVF